MQRSLFDESSSQTSNRIEIDSRFVDRPYQAEAIRGAVEAFEEHPGAIIRAFTGAGKTYMGSRVASEWINRSDKHRVFVCAHERQLVTQFRDEMHEFLGIPIGLEMSNDGRISYYWDHSPRVIVSCRATLQKDRQGLSRLHKFHAHKYRWLLILDEGHRWAYSLPSCRHVLEWFEQSDHNRRLILTATPDRGDGISLERIAPAIALDYPMFSSSGPSAVDDGWAVPFDQRFIHVEGVDFKNLKEVAGDFDKNELEKILQEREQLESMIRPLLDLVGSRRALIFNAGVDLAKAVARAINAERETLLEQGADPATVPGEAEWVDGSVPDEHRNRVFERHQRGEFQFLSVCGLCREGYNDPGIGCVAIFRPTKSAGLAEQMIGRGCRPLRGLVDGLETAGERRAAIAASDKPNCMIIDLVGASGLGKCATTARIYASAEEDIPCEELAERANQHLLDDEGGDIGDAVAKAKAEITAEREQARVAREEAERLAQEEAKRQAKLKAEVRYQQSSHVPEGSRSSFGSYGEPATVKQVRFLAANGIHEAVASQWTKKQASAVISKMKSKSTPSDFKKFPSDAPATEAQVRVLQKFGFESNVSAAEAARIITEDINRGVLAR